MSEKIKVLWLCNIAFSDTESKASGSWLISMTDSLIDSGEVELFSITEGDVKKVTRQNHRAINQWIIPRGRLKQNGLPDKRIVLGIQELVEQINPDIIHIWGTEKYWGLLHSRGYIKGNMLLEIQGFKFSCVKYFYLGLSFWDIIKCFRFKEFLKPSTSIIGLKLSFKKWGKFEKEMVKVSKNISTQSQWVRTHVKNINIDAKIFKAKIALRKEFLEASKWDFELCNPFQVFTSSSSTSISYKGLHILLDAIAILKPRFPQIKLVIAGDYSKGIRMDGYSRFLHDKILRKGIVDNVSWVGSLNAKSIISQIQESNVVVVSSFVESYCLALDESLTIGAPTVASFSGAMPELAKHRETALFYPSDDVEMCADAIEQFFTDKFFATKISHNAYNRNYDMEPENIVQNQLNIYKTILK